MAAGDTTYLESDGKSVNVSLLATVAAHTVAYVDGWLGITAQSGDSGSSVAMQVDEREYQFSVPAGLSVAKGDTVYITLASVTNHIPQDAAYTTSSGAGKVALFKATSAKDGNNVVTGKLLTGR
jgi:plastocyanin